MVNRDEGDIEHSGKRANCLFEEEASLKTLTNMDK